MKALAILGTILLALFAPLAMVYGLMAFTPTDSSRSAVPMAVGAGGPALVLVLGVVGTWAGRPRLWVPYVAVALIVVLLVVAGRLAS